MKVPVLVVLTCLTFISCAKIPTELERCSFTDEECLKKSAKNLAENFYKGIPSMGLASLDPVEVKEVSILEDKAAKERKPISLNLWFKDWKIYGFKEMVPKRLSGFKKDTANKIYLDVDVPQLQLVGHYKINGQVLVLPIQGEGNSNLTLDNAKVHVITKGDFIERNGKRYLKLFDRPKVDVATSRLHIKLENLFNGNKELGNTMNQFLNDNWSEIYDELKQGIFDALGSVFTNMLNNVFLRIPYDQLFLSTSS